MKQALNLASRPFRNETLPNLGFAAAALALLLLTAEHVVTLRGIVAGASSERQAEVAGLSSELNLLRRESRELRAPRPDAKQVAEWGVVKDLVDRRVFSWSRLLERLAQALPPGVRVVAITPRSDGRRVRVELVVVVRRREQGFELPPLLREQAGFQDVYPAAVVSAEDGERFTYTMWYEAEPARSGAEAAAEGRS